MTVRANNVAFLPDPIPEKSNGIILGTQNPNHRTGTVKSIGGDVRWRAIKEDKRFLYLQRNCVPCDGLQIVSEENVLAQVAEDVVFGYEEITPENKIKVHLVKEGATA